MPSVVLHRRGVGMVDRMRSRWAAGAVAVAVVAVLGAAPVGDAWASGGWSGPTSVDAGNALAAISCPNARFCVAVDGAGNAVIHKRNNTWAAPLSLDPGSGGLASVSCSSTQFCVAVDRAGGEDTYTRGRWIRTGIVDGSTPLDTVSCVRTNECFALDSAGNALYFDGFHWSAPTSVDPGNVPESVSCTSTRSCIAVDNQGNDLTYDGSTWSAPTGIDPGNVLESVSCPTVTFCIAVDNQGNDLTDDGSSWTAPTSVDAGNVLTSVSCYSMAFCIGADDVGQAVTLPPPLAITTSSLPPATLDETYTATLSASGGNPPYRWLTSTLPTGLSIDRRSGVISGTPRGRSGTFTFNVIVRDMKIRGSYPTQNQRSRRLSLTIAA